MFLVMVRFFEILWVFIMFVIVFWFILIFLLKFCFFIGLCEVFCCLFVDLLWFLLICELDWVRINEGMLFVNWFFLKDLIINGLFVEKMLFKIGLLFMGFVCIFIMGFLNVVFIFFFGLMYFCEIGCERVLKWGLFWVIGVVILWDNGIFFVWGDLGWFGGLFLFLIFMVSVEVFFLCFWIWILLLDGGWLCCILKFVL